MYDLLGPLVMSVHDPAKFQQYSVIFAKSAADTKNHMFFRGLALFMTDSVYTYAYGYIYIHIYLNKGEGRHMELFCKYIFWR